jgi:hypothetical protein
MRAEIATLREESKIQKRVMAEILCRAAKIAYNYDKLVDEVVEDALEQLKK